MLDDELHCRVIVFGNVCLRKYAGDGKVFEKQASKGHDMQFRPSGRRLYEMFGLVHCIIHYGGTGFIHDDVVGRYVFQLLRSDMSMVLGDMSDDPWVCDDVHKNNENNHKSPRLVSRNWNDVRAKIDVLILLIPTINR